MRELLDEVKEILEQLNVDILPEIHEHYSIQMKIAEKGHYPAFEGDYSIVDTDSEEILEISWKKDEFKTILKANVKTHKFTIKYFDVDSNEFKELAEV
jgi:hypothetical protein